MDVPNGDSLTSRPSPTGGFISNLPVGVEQRLEHSVMSLSFMRGAPATPPSARSQRPLFHLLGLCGGPVEP